jgi:isopenicillin-N N-acyltransferase-like protein
MAVITADADGWLLHTNHFLDPALSVGDTMPADSTTAERLAHLSGVRHAMQDLPAAARASALCGPAGADAAVCMRPDESMPTHEQWGTLLTIGLDTDACALDYAAGDPDQAARTGFARF